MCTLGVAVSCVRNTDAEGLKYYNVSWIQALAFRTWETGLHIPYTTYNYQANFIGIRHRFIRLQDFLDVKGEMESLTRGVEGSGQVIGEETGVWDLERLSIAISSVEGLLLPFFTFLRNTSLCSPSPKLKE